MNKLLLIAQTIITQNSKQLMFQKIVKSLNLQSNTVITNYLGPVKSDHYNRGLQ
jgi:hypothetical protein